MRKSTFAAAFALLVAVAVPVVWIGMQLHQKTAAADAGTRAAHAAEMAAQHIGVAAPQR